MARADARDAIAAINRVSAHWAISGGGPSAAAVHLPQPFGSVRRPKLRSLPVPLARLRRISVAEAADPSQHGRVVGAGKFEGRLEIVALGSAAQEQPGGGGDVEPLLLPWGGIKSTRYTWNGTQFVKTDE